MIALPRNRMEFCIKLGTFGLNRKYILGKVAEGDGVVCYVTKESKVIGFGNVTRGYYLDIEPVFGDQEVFGITNDLYPDRFDFKCTPLSRSAELAFLEFIEKMSFIKNLAHWSVHFSSGITEISKSDWDVLAASCTVQPS